MVWWVSAEISELGVKHHGNPPPSSFVLSQDFPLGFSKLNRSWCEPLHILLIETGFLGILITCLMALLDVGPSGCEKLKLPLKKDVCLVPGSPVRPPCELKPFLGFDLGKSLSALQVLVTTVPGQYMWGAQK